MHDGMPYDLIQGQGHDQGHKCLKATQEESTVSPTLIFLRHTVYGSVTVLN